MTTISTN